MDKRDKFPSKSCKIKVSQSKLNNRAMRKRSKSQQRAELQPNKKNWSPLRKALNELDPNFDNYIRKITKPPTLEMKDLKVQVKKAKEEKDKKKKSSK